MYWNFTKVNFEFLEISLSASYTPSKVIKMHILACWIVQQRCNIFSITVGAIFFCCFGPMLDNDKNTHFISWIWDIKAGYSTKKKKKRKKKLFR